MLESRLLYVLGNLLQSVHVRELFFCDGEPAEPITLVCPAPERSILLPQARDFIVLLPIFERYSNRPRKRTGQLVSLAVQTHARTPASLPTAASTALKASANSLTPSPISLSFTSFLEIP